MTSSFIAGALSLPLLAGTVAFATPAVAQQTSPDTTVATVETQAKTQASGKVKKASRKVAPSRSHTKFKFGTVRYNKWYAKQYMDYKYGWGDKQFKAVEKLWTRESGWRQHAHNGSSGAHGIPQSLPGSKMASHGRDWRTNPETQIRWGLSYIKGRYGSPMGAWNHSQRVGWY